MYFGAYTRKRIVGFLILFSPYCCSVFMGEQMAENSTAKALREFVDGSRDRLQGIEPALVTCERLEQDHVALQQRYREAQQELAELRKVTKQATDQTELKAVKKECEKLRKECVDTEGRYKALKSSAGTATVCKWRKLILIRVRIF